MSRSPLQCRVADSEEDKGQNEMCFHQGSSDSFPSSSLHSIPVLVPHDGEEGGVDALFRCKVRFNKINVAIQSVY